VLDNPALCWYYNIILNKEGDQKMYTREEKNARWEYFFFKKNLSKDHTEEEYSRLCDLSEIARLRHAMHCIDVYSLYNDEHEDYFDFLEEIKKIFKKFKLKIKHQPIEFIPNAADYYYCGGCDEYDEVEDHREACIYKWSEFKESIDQQIKKQMKTLEKRFIVRDLCPTGIARMK